MWRACLSLILALLAGVAVPTAAQVTEYTNRPAFLAAVSSATNIDFEGLAPAGGVHVENPLTLSGVTFISNGTQFIIDSGFYGFPYPGAFESTQFGSPNDELTAMLPAGTTAVGADIGGLFTGGTTFTVTLSTGDVFSVPVSGSPKSGTLDFAGFISASADITSITFSASDNLPIDSIDNFVFGKTASVPEPRAAALITCLLISVISVYKRRWSKLAVS